MLQVFILNVEWNWHKLISNRDLLTLEVKAAFELFEIARDRRHRLPKLCLFLEWLQGVHGSRTQALLLVHCLAVLGMEILSLVL